MPGYLRKQPHQWTVQEVLNHTRETRENLCSPGLALPTNAPTVQVMENTTNTSTAALPAAWADVETRGDNAYAYIAWRDETTNEVARRQNIKHAYLGTAKKWDEAALDAFLTTFNSLAQAGMSRSSATVREVREVFTQVKSQRATAAQALAGIASSHKLEANATSAVANQLEVLLATVSENTQDGTK